MDISSHFDSLKAMYQGKRAEYGEVHSKFHKIIAILFPQGIILDNSSVVVGYFFLTMVLHKLIRYCNKFPKVTHGDSMTDLTVYSAMLDKLVEPYKESENDLR